MKRRVVSDIFTCDECGKTKEVELEYKIPEGWIEISGTKLVGRNLGER